MSTMKSSHQSLIQLTTRPVFQRLLMRSWRVFLTLLMAVVSVAGTFIVVRAAALITATKADVLLDDADSSGAASPGDTLEYTVIITNSGADAATGVAYNDDIDSNTTLVPGSVTYSPIAVDDTYPETILGNVSVDSALISYSVIANDNLGNPAGTITAYDATTAQGGQVSMVTSGVNMGQFTYNPPPGFEGTDTFTYTLTNATGNMVATVSMPIAKMVWFINNTASSCTTLAAGCGRLSNPFSTLAAFQALNNGTGNNPGSNDVVFIYESASPYPDPLTLLSGQLVVGQDATASLATIGSLTPSPSSTALPATDSANGVVVNLTGTVTLNTNVIVRGLQINSTTNTGLTDPAGSISGVTVADMSIATTTGTPVLLSNTGGSFTLKSISANGAANGISLTNTIGSFTVDGDGVDVTVGGNSSGGVIQNIVGADGATAGNGVYLSNAQNVSLRRMRFSSNSNFAISGTTVNGFALEYSTVNGTNGSSAANDEGSVAFTGLIGEASVRNVLISGGYEDNFRVRNSSGSLDRIIFDTVTIGANNTSAGNDGIALDASGSATINATVQNSTFTSTRADFFQLNVVGSASSDLIFHDNTLSNSQTPVTGGGGITIGVGDNTGSANLTFNINGNSIRGSDGNAFTIFKSTDSGTVQGTFSNNIIGQAGTGNSGSLFGSGVKIQNAGLGTVTVRLSGNQIYQYDLYGIELLTGGGASAYGGNFNATITGNTIANPGANALNGINLNGGTVPGDTYAICADVGGVGAQANTINGSGANGGTDFRLRQRQSTTVRLPGYGGTAGDTTAVVTYVRNRNNNSGSTTGSAAVNTPPGGGFTGGAACAQPIVMTPENRASAKAVAKTVAPRNVSFPETTFDAIDSLVSFESPRDFALSTTSDFGQSILSDNNWAEPRIVNAAIPTVSLGTLPAGKSVTIKFQVTINDPLSPVNATQVSNQGSVSGTNFSTTLTDDPDTVTLNDPTITLLPWPDLTALKSNSVGGTAILPAGWTWTIDVSNSGTGVADFASGEVILVDDLPASGLSYGSVSVTNASGVGGTGSINCAIDGSSTLTCAAAGGNVTLAASTGGFDVEFDATPAVAGSYSNPRTAGTCAVDTSNNLNESDESNNTCSNSVTVQSPPTITSANNAIFTVGTAGSFTVTTTPGYPTTTTLSQTGTLPSGVTFTDNGDGTATLAGTPANGAGGSYPVTITASNGVLPNATQNFTLTVNESPSFTSTASDTFAVGTAGSFAITTDGYPDAAISLVSSVPALPAGITLIDNSDGTATLSGTPVTGDGGVYTLSLAGDNGINPDASQTFTLTINEAPSIISADNVTFSKNVADSFTITATGHPLPSISHTGLLPAGVTFTDNGDGTATLGGTPTEDGAFSLTITAANSVLPNATQSFTLTVNGSPAITSANNTAFVAGVADTFTITTSGTPDVTNIGQTGTLPGGVSFLYLSGTTATLSGTANAGTGGVYALQFAATNGIAPDASQNFTLTINESPSITSANNVTFTVGIPGSFTVTTAGYPSASLSSSGALPGGVTFTDNGDGTATLSGTPADGDGNNYSLTFTATNGVGSDATQNFTLTVNESPTFTNANSASFLTGSSNSFMFTTDGYPDAAISLVSSIPSLPASITLTDNGDGTASLAGTPGIGDGGVYTLSLLGDNGINPDATQTFTLTIGQPPVITSAITATFTVGALGSFTVTTSGYPVPVLSQSGALPSGVTFTDNGDGTATLGGTPADGTGESYSLTFTADNGVTPDGTQNFTLIVNEAPTFTSVNNTTFTVGTAGSFMITTDGYPDAAISLVSSTPALPASISLTDNGDGTATISGTPIAGDGGLYTLSLAGANGTNPDAAQTFTLTINEAPNITSANNVTFTVGSAGSFTVTTSGYPVPGLSQVGALPSGITFTDNGNGTATLSGTPADGTGDSYSLTFTADNGVSPNATQNFTLTVNEAPTFTSANNTTFIVGTAESFTITTDGYPDATINLVSSTPALPASISFTDNGDGTATLSGTPVFGDGGVYTLSLAGANGINPDAVQAFTLNIGQPPSITSANNITFTVGALGSFTVTTTGYPTPSLSNSGALPSGVTFTDNGDGTATLAGTPADGTGNSYGLVFTAANGIGVDVTQNFTLTVNESPTFTSADNSAFTVGTAGSFTITTDGYPGAAISLVSSTPALPASVTLTDNGDGTATLSGTPVAGDGGVYTLSLAGDNGINPDASQTFTLTIGQAPTITSANSATFASGTAGSFTVTATGYPNPALSQTGALPTGVTFVDNGDGTATLSGTPADGTGGSYSLTFTANNGVTPNGTQNFTLIVNESPTFTSTDHTGFSVGNAGSFTITTDGYPDAAIGLVSSIPALPASIALTDNGDGTATLSGTPASGDEGTYTLSLNATNLEGADTQSFTLTITLAPVITSVDNFIFVLGTPGTFTVTTTGNPTPSLSSIGTLPSGITFTDNGDGTATLAGTAASGSVGVYNLTITASNGSLPDATQAFTLTVEGPPGVEKINSVADTGDAQIVEKEHTSQSITQLLVVFTKSMNAVDAQNLANYNLVRGGSIPIMINSATYDGPSRTATLNVNGGVALPNGKYTLTVKNAIKDDTVPGTPFDTDFVRIFYIDSGAPHRTTIQTLPKNQSITNGATIDSKFSSIRVYFDEDVFDPTGSSDPDDVTNLQNYWLLTPGPNAAFDTVSCLAGLAGDDVRIATNTVTYTNNGDSDVGPFVATVSLNGGVALNNGSYRLIICATTSIVDLAGNVLNNGVDDRIDFTVLAIAGLDNPATGFAPGRVTLLPEQPIEKAYTDLGSLWLEMPSLRVKSGIVGVTPGQQGWDVAWLNQQVGWLQGTAYPTFEGNSVLTAHNFTPDGNAGPFSSLQNLKYGEQIIVHSGGWKYTYEIRSNFLVSANNTYWLTKHEEYSWVTLVTCQQFDEKTQTYRYRRIVRAVLVSIEKE